ncbi:hypothetical protein [Methanocella sp. MCL-LM]|uniref:hypothetical protein n=1 Tax=Methanocella sp. MCL-LM TaxID=3412035 RepID=UPI003C7570C5
MGELDSQRDYYLLYLTILFGLLTVASAGVPLALDSDSAIKVGVGYFILLVGLAPLPFVLYKMLVVFLKPFLNDSKQAIKLEFLAFLGYFVINFINNLFGHNQDAVGFTMILIYGLYSAFIFILVAAMQKVLMDKGVETSISIIYNTYKEFSKTLLYKDLVYVYLFPLGYYLFSFAVFLTLPYMLFGPWIAIVISFCFTIILALDGSTTRWRKNRNEIDTLSLIDSIKKNFIPIYLLPILLYVVSVGILFTLIVVLLYLSGIKLPEANINDRMSIVIGLLFLLIVVSIPYIISVKAAIYLLKRNNKGLSHVPVPVKPVFYITNITNILNNDKKK